MAASKSKDIGKWFEEKCSVPLKELCSKKGRMFYPFPDSRSSRGLVQNQPGEFMLILNKKPVLIECKASAKHPSFRGCMASMVRDAQYGWHKRWHLSGSESLFLFYSDVSMTIEVWDGKRIVEARRDRHPLEKGGYLIKFDVAKQQAIPEAMNKLIQFYEI